MFTRESQRIILAMLIKSGPVSVILADLAEVCREQTQAAHMSRDVVTFERWDWITSCCSSAFQAVSTMEAITPIRGGESFRHRNV